MGLAALMVNVLPDDSGDARLRLAADLADQLEAVLIGVAAETFLAPSEGFPLAGAGPSLSEAVNQQIRAELDAAQARFHQLCGGVKKGVEWRAFRASPRTALAAQARAADLFISGVGEDAGFIERQASADELVMSIGRPVLIGPAEAERLDLSRIVVAWKDSRESRRALADAMPLLRRAERVLVVSAPEGGREEDATIALADVAETIRRHGGEATTRLLPGAGAPADAILEAAVNFDSELIVAGAYGHSRMQEWVFGGVTHRLLRQEAKFVLFSH